MQTRRFLVTYPVFCLLLPCCTVQQVSGHDKHGVPMGVKKAGCDTGEVRWKFISRST